MFLHFWSERMKVWLYYKLLNFYLRERERGKFVYPVIDDVPQLINPPILKVVLLYNGEWLSDIV